MRSRNDLPAVTISGDLPVGQEVLPEAYRQSLFPPLPEPSFETPEELERCGARDGVRTARWAGSAPFCCAALVKS
jgi:hypothetical protein